METSSSAEGSSNHLKKSIYRQYLVFWVSQNLSMFGSAIVMFAVTWEMADLIGNDNTLLSLIFFLGFLPFVLFSPIAGVVADKYDKKIIILISDSVQALLTLCLFIIMITTQVRLWHFLLLNSLRSICQAFHSPIGFTLVSIFVPKDKITQINGLNFLFQNIVNIIAAPIAVLLLLVVDLKILLWLDILSFGIAVIPLMKLPIPKNRMKQAENLQFPDSNNLDQVDTSKKGSFFQDFKEGFESIIEIPGMINLLIIATFINFFFQPFDTLLINFVKYSHGGEIQQYGILTSSIQIGVFIGAIAVSIKKKWHHWVFYLCGGLLSTGVVTLLISFVPIGNFLMLYILAGFMMLMNPIVNTLFHSLLQLKIPPEKMGRVISIITTILVLMRPIGIILAGLIADVIDSIPLVYTGSAIFAIVFSIFLFVNPKVVKLLKDGEKLSLQIHNESELIKEKEIN